VEKSATIGELAKALAKAQAAMKPVIADSENPYFKSKYADLAAVWENCRKPLTDNGLSVVQVIEHEDNTRVVVKTILLHESGEWISSRLGLTPVKNDPQSIGSAITYGRRYSLAAMVGVCAEDEDDDAEKATGRDHPTPPPTRTSQQHHQPQQKNNTPQEQQKSQQKSQQKPGAAGSPLVTDQQLKKIYATSRSLGLEKETMIAIIQKRYQKQSSKELTKQEASDLIEYMTKLENGEESWVPGDAWEPEGSGADGHVDAADQ